MVCIICVLECYNFYLLEHLTIKANSLYSNSSINSQNRDLTEIECLYSCIEVCTESIYIKCVWHNPAFWLADKKGVLCFSVMEKAQGTVDLQNHLYYKSAAPSTFSDLKTF